MNELEAENERLRQEVAELRELLQAALSRIKELEAQVGQNSRNSSWPSSRDKGKRRSKSLRKRSGKRPGGQPGHEGHTLEFNPEPTQIVDHRPVQCIHCESEFGPDEQMRINNRRQVVDLPPMMLEVTEHRTQSIVCRCCGRETSGLFPADVTNPVQYGPRIKGAVVYLKQAQLIPYERTREMLGDLFGVTMSPGTLQNIVAAAAKRLAPVMEQIKCSLQGVHSLHCDESGFYIGGNRQWLHSAGSRQLTYYLPHPSRGTKALKTMGILDGFSGTAIHDFWSSYWTFDNCNHAACNVHLLRDLNAQEEQGDQPWATRFKHFLLAAKTVVEKARQRGEYTLSSAKLAQVERIFVQLVNSALLANPPPPGGWPRGKRGRPKKTKARNLAERIAKYRTAILAFVYDFNVPFDNNLAERDLRMLKVQQKISGCFRSHQGAEDFCAIRSYISTLRKQNLDVWTALNSLFTETLVEPDYTPV